MISDYLRLKKEEKKLISELSNEVNKQRLENNLGVIKESELVHLLLKEAFAKTIVINGQIKFK